MSMRGEKCSSCVQRSLLTCWILLIITDLMYLGVASASLTYFGAFKHPSFVYHRRVNIETMVAASLAAVSGGFGVFGTVFVKRRVVFGAMLALLATFALLVAAYVNLRQMENPFAEHTTSEPTSEVMDAEIAAYVERLSAVTTAGDAARANTTGLLSFMNVGQTIFQCCGKASYRDYRHALLPKSCCRDACYCPTRARMPDSRVFNTSVIYDKGCVYNMYKWVVLVTLAGLNLATFCVAAVGCLLVSGLFLYLHRHKRDAGRSVPTGSMSQRSATGTSMVLIVIDDRDDEMAADPAPDTSSGELRHEPVSDVRNL